MVLGLHYRISITVAFLTLVYLFFLTGSQLTGASLLQDHSTPPLFSSALRQSDNILDIQNRTLGFQEIVAISLPERVDKRDGLTVAARLSNIDIKFVDGVVGSEVSPKALPHTMNRLPNVVGCWRAHMNALQDMVSRNISSTLFLEDDADWDVAVKHQLLEFARGSRYLQRTAPQTRPNSPYGDDWDMLWVGHCGLEKDPEEHRRWVIPNDPTAVPFEKHGPSGRANLEPLDPLSNNTRVVIKTGPGICMAGFAFSIRGAMKALYGLSMLPWDGPVDWGYGGLCKNSPLDLNFTCISPFPAIIGIHRPAGNISRWSDIEIKGGSSDESNIREKAFSQRLVFPTRMNIDRLLLGNRLFASQSPDSTGPEMDMEEMSSARGHAELVVNGEAQLVDTDTSYT